MTGRALVLGSGGLTGIAWETGLLAGLAANGTDLTSADLIVGTSAGAVTGAQIASGAALEDLYQAQLGPPPDGLVGRLGTRLKFRYVLAMASSKDPVRVRVRLGRMSLRSPLLPEDQRRAIVGARLPSHEWPAQRLIITAVDVDSGDCAAFDATSGITLVEAVAASCAVPGVWPPVTINGRRWMDGGMRSSANADLAAGYERVVVIAPIRQGFRDTVPSAAAQCAALCRNGCAAIVITPDRAAVAAIGRNLLDPARAPDAARAGYAQAATVAASVAGVWSGVPDQAPGSPAST